MIERHPDRVNEGILLEIYRQYEKDEVFRLLFQEHKLLRIENGMLKSEYNEKIDALKTEIKALAKNVEKYKKQRDEYQEKYQQLYQQKYK